MQEAEWVERFVVRLGGRGFPGTPESKVRFLRLQMPQVSPTETAAGNMLWLFDAAGDADATTDLLGCR